ncbi:MAG: DUF2292 domain-containing protein [bacterium]
MNNKHLKQIENIVKNIKYGELKIKLKDGKIYHLEKKESIKPE